MNTILLDTLTDHSVKCETGSGLPRNVAERLLGVPIGFTSGVQSDFVGQKVANAKPLVIGRRGGDATSHITPFSVSFDSATGKAEIHLPLDMKPDIRGRALHDARMEAARIERLERLRAKLAARKAK
jgi:hypothetical protein